MKWKWIICATVLLALWDNAAYPQVPPDPNQYVSRQEYEKLKQEIDAPEGIDNSCRPDFHLPG